MDANAVHGVLGTPPPTHAGKAFSLENIRARGRGVRALGRGAISKAQAAESGTMPHAVPRLRVVGIPDVVAPKYGQAQPSGSRRVANASTPTSPSWRDRPSRPCRGRVLLVVASATVDAPKHDRPSRRAQGEERMLARRPALPGGTGPAVVAESGLQKGTDQK